MPVSSDASVTTWIGLLRGGDREAAQPLWERYFVALTKIAQGKLRGASRRARDEEDVALSAFHSFCRGAHRFPRLNDRNDLWQVLIMLTARKAFQERRRQQTARRGGPRDGEDRRCAEGDDGRRLDEIVGSEPTPEFGAMIAENFDRLMAALPDDPLRRIARLRMEGHTNDEVAAELECSTRTVERKLMLIRGFWEKDVAST